MQSKNLLFALGLCAKAGKIICGVPMICEAMGGKKHPVIVIAASDNAKNSAKRLTDKCAYYGVTLYQSEIDGDTLAHAVGKTGRLAAVGVTDSSLAQLVVKNIGEAPAEKTDE